MADTLLVEAGALDYSFDMRSSIGLAPRASARLGVTTLVLAVVADVGASLLVTLNALRLLRLDGHDRGR